MTPTQPRQPDFKPPFEAKDGKLLYFDKEIPAPDEYANQNAHNQQQVAKQFNQLWMAGFNFALTLVAREVTQPNIQIPSPNGEVH